MTRADRLWQAAAASACLALVVTLILNIHPVGDGMWFWYAVELRHGLRLYRDLHLPLQPLYVVLTAAFQIAFGESWLASKVMPLLQGIALTVLLVQLARYVPWSAAQRALLTVAAFLCILRPSTYRFDDYHVTSDLCTLAVLLLLLRLGTALKGAGNASTGTSRLARSSFAMGLCAGLAAMTRLNDGAALLLAAVLILLLLYPRRAVAATASVAAGTVVACTAVLAVLRETPWGWFRWSVQAAGAIKGGTGNVLFSPLLLPWHLLASIASWKTPITALFAGTLWLAVHRLQRRNRRGRSLPWLAEAALWSTLLLLLAFPLVHHTQADLPLELLVRVGTLLLLVCVAGGAWAAAALWTSPRTVHEGQHDLSHSEVRRRRLLRAEFALLLLPLLHLLGGALTAAGTLPDPYLSLAMMFLIAPLLVSVERVRDWAWPSLAPLLLFAAIILHGKVHQPYDWYTYTDGPVYQDRVWYRHPDFGPMYIERPQLARMQAICAVVNGSDTSASMLSLPFPYPNYFCNRTPWHNTVQTWYDTSSVAVIQALVAALAADPPRWIVYQRALNAMVAHEVTYHHGKPLPHRALDGLIQQRIRSGAWSVRYQACDRGTNWLLVQTSPADDAPTASAAALALRGDGCP